MKILNSIDELWAYFRFCPFCQKNNRNISMYFGPEDSYVFSSFKKNKQFLHIKCLLVTYNPEVSMEVVFHINLDNNSIDFSYNGKDKQYITFIEKTQFFFFLEATCDCDKFYSASVDFECDLSESKLLKLPTPSIEREIVYIEDYVVNLKHDLNRTTIYNSKTEKTMKFPFSVDFNFTDTDAVLNRIDTLTVFQ